ncbi:hypothetical protein [Aestuariivirga sp.]|uniref:hypothetical protein n=1 Tax=Aestuariivirga sp. TaxID=2650926 RepID=UPI0039E4C9B3
MNKLLAATALLAVMAAPASAHKLKPGCNEARQNWLNGSQTTCPVRMGEARTPLVGGPGKDTGCDWEYEGDGWGEWGSKSRKGGG